MKRAILTGLFAAAIGLGAASAPAADPPAANAGAALAAAEPRPAPTLAEVAPEVVATVNGKPLTREQLAAIIVIMDGKSALDTLINQEVIRQEAARQGLAVTKEEIEAYIHQRARYELDAMGRRNGGKDFAEWGAKAGLTPQEVAGMVRDREETLRVFAGPEVLAERMVVKTIQVSEADVREAFDRQYGPKAKALQIVVRSKADAEEVIRKLKLGADFAAMAAEVSEDKVSRRVGGAMPPLSRGSTLGDAAFRLTPGEISEPVQTPDGIHILKLVALQPAAGVRYDEVKAALRDGLIESRRKEQTQSWLSDILAKAVIKKSY